MATPTPTPTPKPTAVTLDNSAPIDVGNKSKDVTGWAAASAAKYNTTGFNIPNMTGMQTGGDIYNAIEALAHSNKDQGNVWGPIRNILQQMTPYSKKERVSIWTTKDTSTLKTFIQSLNATNSTVNKANPLSLAQYVSAQTQAFKGTGSPLSTSTALTVPKVVSVPATADLAKVAQDAFSSTLGRSASPSEAADFAQKYQKLVLSYGDAKNDTKNASSFAPPVQPIDFQPNGQTAPAQPASAPIDSTAIMAPPTASVAASNYAAKANPTQASAQAAADGLNQFMSMLKGQ